MTLYLYSYFKKVSVQVTCNSWISI